MLIEMKGRQSLRKLQLLKKPEERLNLLSINHK